MPIGFKFPCLPEVAGDGDYHPRYPNEPSTHAICYLAGPGNVCQLQSKTAVDNAQSDEDPSNPNVSVGPNLALSFAFIHEVVDNAEESLESKQAEYRQTNDYVGFIPLLQRC